MQLIRVAKQTSKRLLTIATASVVAFSGLVVAAPTFFAGSAHAASNNLYVNSATGNNTRTCLDPANPCRTVSKAVQNANADDTIIVAAGTYAETVSVTKSLTFVGAQTGVAGASHSGSESNVTEFDVSVAGVTIDGFTTSRVSINSSTKLSGLHIENNIFSGYTDVALPTYNAGNINVEKNYFTNPSGSAEAMQIKADTVSGGCDDTQVLNNVFNLATTNGAADVNFSCTNSASSNVTVSGNTSTGVVNGQGASFAAFSGIIGGITVSNNVATSEGSSVFFFGSVSGAGTATISGNHFTSSNNAVAIYGGEFSGDSSNSGIFSITNNDFSGSTAALKLSASAFSPSTGTVTMNDNDLSGAGVVNLSSTAVDATSNYWGASPNFTTLISGSNVTYSPYYVNSSMTRLNTDTPSVVYVDSSYNSSSAGEHEFGWDAYSTIGQAISAVSAGGTVNVSAGDYTSEGALSVSKNVTLNGAQTGVDARTRSVPSSQETTVVGFTFTSANATVDGFRMVPGSDNSGVGVRLQDGSSENIRNNIITGYDSEGIGLFGASNVTIQSNVFSASPSSSAATDGIFAGSGTSDNVQILDNKFTSASTNGGADVSLSYDSGDSPVISGNASTGGATLVALFNSSNAQISNNTFVGDQSYTGSIIYIGGGDSHVAVSNNTMSGSAGGAVAVANVFGDGINSDISITGNTITGSVRGLSIGSGSIADSDTIVAHHNKITGNTLGARNLAVGALDASSNWWGNALGPESSQYSGNVTVSPWCSVSDCSATQTASSGTVTLPTGPISTPEVSGSTASVTIPSTNDVVATTSTSAGTVQVTIPSGTTVTADDATWDGTIQAPTVTTVDIGSTKTVALAIEVGAGNINLTFDQAVRLVLPGQAGKLVGFVRDNSFTQISNVCSADSQTAGDALGTGGNCYINVGSDLVVWTKHFTTFVAYSQTSSNSGGGSNSGGSSSGSGGSSSSGGTTTTSSSSGSSTGNSGGVQAASNDNGGKTSSTNTNKPPVASLSQPKIAAKEASGGGLRWYWLVLIAVASLCLAAMIAYRYAEGTDRN